MKLVEIDGKQYIELSQYRDGGRWATYSTSSPKIDKDIPFLTLSEQANGRGRNELVLYRQNMMEAKYDDLGGIPTSEIKFKPCECGIMFCGYGHKCPLCLRRHYESDE